MSVKNHPCEAELVHFANVVFPAAEESEGKWLFFDSNHSFERVFRWPLVVGQELRSPWKDHVPTMTGQSSLAGRRKKEGNMELKKLHGLEAMRLIGWDLGHWKNHASPFIDSSDTGITPELLNNMAGNAWSSFSYSPLAIVALGSAPASWYHQDGPWVDHTAWVDTGDEDSRNTESDTLSDGSAES